MANEASDVKGSAKALSEIREFSSLLVKALVNEYLMVSSGLPLHPTEEKSRPPEAPAG